MAAISAGFPQCVPHEAVVRMCAVDGALRKVLCPVQGSCFLLERTIMTVGRDVGKVKLASAVRPSRQDGTYTGVPPEHAGDAGGSGVGRPRRRYAVKIWSKKRLREKAAAGQRACIIFAARAQPLKGITCPPQSHLLCRWN